MIYFYRFWLLHVSVAALVSLSRILLSASRCIFQAATSFPCCCFFFAWPSVLIFNYFLIRIGTTCFNVSHLSLSFSLWLFLAYIFFSAACYFQSVFFFLSSLHAILIYVFFAFCCLLFLQIHIPFEDFRHIHIKRIVSV